MAKVKNGFIYKSSMASSIPLCLQVTLEGRESSGVFTRADMKEQIIRLIRMLSQFAETLNALPKVRFLTMKMVYYEVRGTRSRWIPCLIALPLVLHKLLRRHISCPCHRACCI